MSIIGEIERARLQAIREVELIFDNLIRQVAGQLDLAHTGSAQANGQPLETVYPLSTSSGIFKGKKPTRIIFGENDEVVVRTWKMVCQEMMRRCISDPEKFVHLMNLRGYITGRDRELLSKTPGNMRSPLEIAENLYMETHYDTETLLKVLMNRILDAVHYDYSHVSVAVRNSQ